MEHPQEQPKPIDNQFWLFNGFEYQTKSDEETYCWHKEDDNYSLMVTPLIRGENKKEVYHFQFFDADDKLIASNAISGTSELLSILVRGTLKQFVRFMADKDGLEEIEDESSRNHDKIN